MTLYCRLKKLFKLYISGRKHLDMLWEKRGTITFPKRLLCVCVKITAGTYCTYDASKHICQKKISKPIFLKWCLYLFHSVFIFLHYLKKRLSAHVYLSVNGSLCYSAILIGFTKLWVMFATNILPTFSWLIVFNKLKKHFNTKQISFVPVEEYKRK